MKLNNSRFTLIVFLICVFSACTDLSPQIEEFVTGEEYIAEARDLIKADMELIGGFIEPAYTPLYQAIGERNIYALTESTTDEMVTPTRGTDWGDNGIWVALHQHTWTSDHLVVRNGWNDLSAGVSRAYEVLGNMEAISEEDQSFQTELQPYFAEVKALRAYYMWQFVDLFGQVLALDDQARPTVLSREEGTNFIITDLEEIIPQMLGKEDNIEYGRVVRQTAQAILAKVYLNRFIYLGEGSAPAADMDKVIALCDAIINSGEYALADDYFEMFDQDNEDSPETLLVLQNTQETIRGFNSQTRILMTLHYNQRGAGAVPLEPWNGMATTEDFFYSWDTDGNTNGVQTNDNRFYDNRYLELTGIPLGFLEGQQVGSDGNDLEDRNGNPLVYTAEIGNLLQASEAEGVRVIKWFPDMDTPVQVWGDNDIALLRYADVILMKAEALWRKGDNAQALALINELRNKRGAVSINAISADGREILDERGFELYWEGHRRTDLIRFNQFTQGTWWAKDVSEDYRSIFPIPATALSANPNLVQNPGY